MRCRYSQRKLSRILQVVCDIEMELMQLSTKLFPHPRQGLQTMGRPLSKPAESRQIEALSKFSASFSPKPSQTKPSTSNATLSSPCAAAVAAAGSKTIGLTDLVNLSGVCHGLLQMKFAASSVLPVPVYTAIWG